MRALGTDRVAELSILSAKVAVLVGMLADRMILCTHVCDYSSRMGLDDDRPEVGLDQTKSLYNRVMNDECGGGGTRGGGGR